MERKQIAFALTLLMTITSVTSCKSKEPKHSHDYGTLVAAKEATCEEKGNIAYYHCEECNTYFNEAKEEIQESSIEVEAKGHDYDMYGNCKNCTETLVTDIQDLYITSNNINLPIHDGKVYMSYTAICSDDYYYLDLSPLGNYEDNKDEAPNYVKSIEIYEEGSSTNLVTADNYTAEIDYAYWTYRVQLDTVKPGTKYYVIINIDESCKEETLNALYYISAFEHSFNHFGICYVCGFDSGYKLVGDGRSYTYTSETPIKILADEKGYFVSNLTPGKYMLKINGEDVDTTKFSLMLYYQPDESSWSGTSYYEGFFDVKKEALYGLNVEARNEDQEITSLEIYLLVD